MQVSNLNPHEDNTNKINAQDSSDGVPSQNNPKSSKKRIFFAIFAVIVFTVIGAAVYQVLFSKSGESNQTSEQTAPTARSAIVSGSAEVSKDGEAWEKIEDKITLNQGEYVRTSKDGRAIITFEDQSVLRLDTSSSVHLETLNSAVTVVSQISGDTYNRVLDNGQTYTVKVVDSSFSTSGGAYRTKITDSIQTVDVFLGTVSGKLRDTIETIPEGSRFTLNKETNEEKPTVSELSIEELSDDEFVIWNSSRDKHNNNFKDQLGFLKQLSTVVVNEDGKFVNASKQTESAKIKLSGLEVSGEKFQLTWSNSGISAPDGYYISHAVSESSPKVFTETISVTSGTSFVWNYPDGKTHWFRVCVKEQNADEFNECKNGSVSNVIKYSAPSVPSRVVQPGKVDLSVDEDVLKWTFEGTAPNGFVIFFGQEDFLVNRTVQVKKGVTSYNMNNVPAYVGTADVAMVCKFMFVAQIRDFEGCTDFSNIVNVQIP